MGIIEKIEKILFFSGTRIHVAGLHRTASSASDFRSRDCEFKPQLGHISFVEIDREIISTVILSVLLIQGQLLVSWKYVYRVLVNCLEYLACPETV